MIAVESFIMINVGKLQLSLELLNGHGLQEIHEKWKQCIENAKEGPIGGHKLPQLLPQTSRCLRNGR
jgi:hypothetical protein